MKSKDKKIKLAGSPNTGARACTHRFHFVRMIPDTGWWNDDSTIWFGSRRYIATFICEHCGLLKQIKTKEEE